MSLFVKFEASDADVVNGLVAHKLGLNVFLPKKPPEQEQGDGGINADIFMELLVSGITIDQTKAKKIGLCIKPIFSPSDTDDDNGLWLAWKDCSSMFLEPVPSKLASTADKPSDCIGENTLYGYLTKENPITIQKDANAYLYFVRDKRDIFPGKIVEVRPTILESGDVYLWINPTTCQRIPSLSPNEKLVSFTPDNKKVLALWVKWTELISIDYFRRTIDQFEYRLEVPYSGIKKKVLNYSANPSLENINVEKLEVVITLQKGCRDESDHRPLPPNPYEDSVKSVSDWVEKKEKVHETDHIFQQWKDYELEDRRFVIFSAGSEIEKALRSKKLEVSIRDKQGDVQRQSDLTVASVVVAVAAGIIVPEVRPIYDVITHNLSWCVGMLLFVVLLFYSFILWFGFSYIECRVYGRRWITKNLDQDNDKCLGILKKIKTRCWLSWKNFVTRSTQSHLPQSIYRFTGIMIIIIILFELVFYFLPHQLNQKGTPGTENSPSQNTPLKGKESPPANGEPLINNVPSPKATP